MSAIPLPNDNVRPPFPEVFDATMVRTYRECPQKFYNEFILKLAPGKSIHLHAGGAFARGLEVVRKEFWDNGAPPDTALFRGQEALMEFYGDFVPPDFGSGANKSLDRMVGALEYYFNVWPVQSDELKPLRTATGHAIEYNFGEPLHVLHPTTGNPILYAGRFDMVSQMDDAVYPLDDKTATQLGDWWSSQWDLRSQFSGYMWGLERAGYNPQGFFIRGVAILKTKYSHSQAVVYRPRWQLERWYKQTCRDIERMKQLWEEGYWDYNLDESCSSFGGCMFKKLCLSENPSAWYGDYETREWNPLQQDPSAEPAEPEVTDE